MSEYVLDSYALLAFLRDEPDAHDVEHLLIHALDHDIPLKMTEVNYSEVKYIILRKDGEQAWKSASEAIQSLPIQFVHADRGLASTAAEFKYRYTLSLADAFAAALAKQRKAELVTGDAEFKRLEKEIKIRWLTKAKKY